MGAALAMTVVPAGAPGLISAIHHPMRRTAPSNYSIMHSNTRSQRQRLQLGLDSESLLRNRRAYFSMELRYPV